MAPRPGEVLDGYRFIGGDPASEASWEPFNDAPKAGDIIDGYAFKGGDPGDEKAWEKPRESSGLIEDVARQVGGSFMSGVGGAERFVGRQFEEAARPITQGINKVFGTELEPANPLEPFAAAAERSGKSLEAGISAEGKQAKEDTTPTGNIFTLENLSFGKDPSARGVAMQAAGLFGSMAPNFLAAFATRGASLPEQMVAGASVGGAMGAGDAMQTARETLDRMDDKKLLQESSVYRELVEGGMTPKDARARVTREAENLASILTLPVSALGGAATGAILGKAADPLVGMIGSRMGRAGALGLTSGLEESIQETGEGVATIAGQNLAAGTSTPLGENSFGNAALGFLGGGPAGAVRGAFTSAEQRVESDPAPVTPPAEVLEAPSVDAAIQAAEAALADEPTFEQIPPPAEIPVLTDEIITPPRDPVFAEIAQAPTEAPEASRPTEGMTMPELVGALKLTRSDERRAALEAEIERRVAKQPAESVSKAAALEQVAAATAAIRGGDASAESFAAQDAARSAAEAAGASPLEVMQAIETAVPKEGATVPIQGAPDARTVEDAAYPLESENRGYEAEPVDVGTAPAAGQVEEASGPEGGGLVSEAAGERAEEGVAPLYTSPEPAQKTAESIQVPEDAGGRTASWVLREKATGKVIAETFDRKKVEALNTEKYEAVPIHQYLASLNRPAAEKATTVAESATPVQESPAFAEREQEAPAVRYDDYAAPKADKARNILKGQTRTFKTEKTALAFAKQQKLKGYTPREIEPKVWALSRPAKVVDPQAEAARKAQIAKARKTVKREDSAQQVVEKMGGWNWEDASRDRVDPRERKARPFLFRKGGMTIDGIAEVLDANGFDVRDESGAIDATKAREIMEQSFSGPVYSPEGLEIRKARDAAARERYEKEFDKTARSYQGYNALSEEAQAGVSEMIEAEDADRIGDIPEIAEEINDEELDRLWEESERDSARAPAEGEGQGAEGSEGRDGDARAEEKGTLIDGIRVPFARTKAPVDSGKDGIGDRRQQQAGVAGRETAPQTAPSSEGVSVSGDIELSGETESQIRAREALEKKAADDKRKKDAAPSEKDFTLTGSDRPVDEAEARGQKSLFARAPIYFSELSRQIEATKNESMPAAQWKAYIKNLTQKGVKADEIEWTGINEWLDMQPGKVTKSALLEYLAQNGVKVDEVMLGGERSATSRMDQLIVDLDARGYSLLRENDPNTQTRVIVGLRERGTNERLDFIPGEGFESPRGLEIPESIERIGRELASLEEETGTEEFAPEGETKFSQYTLPGGKDYRELLLTLPGRPTMPKGYRVEERDGGFHVINENGSDLGRWRTREAAEASQSRHPDSPAFRSSHFDTPNILAHVRFDERTDADGKRVLFIEEIQSDWAQKGKREGFRAKKPLPAASESDIALERVESELGQDSEIYPGYWESFDKRTGEMITRHGGVMSRDAAMREAIQYGHYDAERRAKEGIPSAPFVGKTEAWVALAVKRMIRYAAENGFDRVAYTTGEQQADRYDLSKRIRRIAVRKLAGDGSYNVKAWSRDDFSDTRVIDRDVHNREQLAELLGKEMADRIVADDAAIKEVTLSDRFKAKEYSGLDLKVGGEGMIAFYDRIVPNVVNDVLKKLGGGRVGEVGIERQLARWEIHRGNGPDGDVLTYTDEKTARRDLRAMPGARLVDRGATQPQPGFDITSAMREKVMGGVALFNRGKAESAPGMSVAEVKEIIAPIILGWTNAPDIKVIDSMADAPASVREDAQRTQDAQAEGVPYAFFYDREQTIYLVASEIRSPEQALTGLFHEALGHYGLRGVFGDKLNTLLGQLAAARQKDVAAKAEEYGLDVLKREDRLLAAEEVLTELAQTRPEISFVRKAIAAIRTFLREMGVDLKLTDDEIIRSYILPARNFVERGQGKGAMKGTTFARRLFTGRQTKHDFVVPETPEFAGNTTGDLAVIAPDAPYIESLPIRLTVGEYRGSHRGFGIEKLEAGAKANPARAPEMETGDRAEDWARNVVKVALGARELYAEDNKIILRNPASKKALVLERRNDARWGDYYSVVSLRPAASAEQWGRAVWAGRGLVQPFGSQQPGAPDPSPEGESLSSDRQSLGVQTTKFDFTEDRPAQQGPTITYKPPKKKIDPTPFARTKPAWVNSPELEAAAAKIDTYAPEKPLKEKIKALSENWVERVTKELVDPFIALKKLTPNGYILARMVKSADTSLEATLRFGIPVLNDDGSISGKLDGKGFLGHMSELNGEHDRFFMWVAGNRAERLMGEGREHLFSADDIKAMKNLIRDQGPNDKWKGEGTRPQAYAKAASALRAYNKAFMDIAEKTGEINGEARKLWEHDFYLPFFRVDEDMKIAGPSKVKGLARNEVLKKLKGGTEPLGDLLDNTIRNWQHVLAASLANQAAKKALDAAVKAGIAVEADEATAKHLEKAGGPTAGATYVMDDGEKHWYTVGDPFVLEAISSMETPSINWAGMKLMRDFKRILTIGVTASPTFRIRNLIRDTSTVIGQNEISYNFVGNVYKGYKATARNSATYAQAMFGGGIIRFGNIHDGKHAEHAKRLILSGVKEQTILDTPTKVRDAIQHAWDWYQENGDRFENTNRMALVQQRIEAGDTNLEAMFAGRDSMDFTLVGANKAVRFLTQVVPFLNARMQGLYKTGRAGVANPKRLGYVVGALTLTSIGLMLAYKDDDEWKKRAQWDRDTYFWFKIGDVAYRIPKGFELGGLASLVERGVEWMISDEMNGKIFAERLWYFIGNTLSLNPIPQIAKPLVDLYANTDSFTGRQIETRGMERLSKPERIGRRTTLVAKTLGKAGNVTQLSPAQIDHVIQAYFGWVGAHAAMAVDVMAEPFLEVPKPARKLDELFVIGDFAKSLPSGQSRYVDDFYKQLKTVQEVMGDLKQARDVRDADKVRQILEDKRDVISLKAMYNNAARSMTDINHKIRKIERANISAEEKRERIDELTDRKNRLAALIAKRTRERQAAR